MSGVGAAYVLSLAAGALAGPVALAALAEVVHATKTPVDRIATDALRLAQRTLAPLRRAGSHGRDPSAGERRRLRIAGAIAGVVAGWAVGGSVAALAGCGAGAFGLPRVAGWRLARYARRVEEGTATAAFAIAGALAAGASIRAAIGSAARELEGPIAFELRRTSAALEAGASVDAALDGLAFRAPSRSTALIAAAIQLQRRSGGDLAALLRRIASSIEAERRAEDEARAATAQARITSTMVLALPPAGIGLAELASPGLVARMLGSQAGAALLAVALGLQFAGAVAVRRLARIGP